LNRRRGPCRSGRSARAVKLVLIALLGLVLAVHVQGCTALGYALGASADAQRGTGGPGLLTNVKPGRSVALRLLDGRLVAGRFTGWSPDSLVRPSSADTLSPRGMRVHVATRRGEVAVPADSIVKVTIVVYGGRVAGTLVGMVGDGVVIAEMLHQPKPTYPACNVPPDL